MTDFKEEMRAKESVLNGEVIVLPLLNARFLEKPKYYSDNNELKNFIIVSTFLLSGSKAIHYSKVTKWY